MNKRLKIALLVIVVFIAFAAFFSWKAWQNAKVAGIDSFETCAAAGYPVLQSYPAQCKTPDGRTFVQPLP